MGRILPILFNGDMVRATLNGSKTVTRMPVRYKYNNTEMKMRTDKYGTRLIEIQKEIEGETKGKNLDGTTWHKLLGYIEKDPPYKKGDILYVRETFCFCPCWDCGLSMEDGACAESNVYNKIYNAKRAEWGCWCYRASCDAGEEPSVDTWHPSIHMPKEIARIWLKVTNVRVERLHEIGTDDYKAEGILPVRPEGLKGSDCDCTWKQDGCKDRPCNNREAYNEMCYLHVFINLWDSTIKPADQELYGWQANPWVWVIEFERCEKPEPCVVKGIEPAEDRSPCIGYGDAWSDEPCEMCKGCTEYSGKMEGEGIDEECIKKSS